MDPNVYIELNVIYLTKILWFEIQKIYVMYRIMTEELVICEIRIDKVILPLKLQIPRKPYCKMHCTVLAGNS